MISNAFCVPFGLFRSLQIPQILQLRGSMKSSFRRYRAVFCTWSSCGFEISCQQNLIPFLNLQWRGETSNAEQAQ